MLAFFHVGVLSVGVFSVGVLSVGVLSVGVFSVGVFLDIPVYKWAIDLELDSINYKYLWHSREKDWYSASAYTGESWT